jgi:hypothetical protein
MGEIESAMLGAKYLRAREAKEYVLGNKME